MARLFLLASVTVWLVACSSPPELTSASGGAGQLPDPVCSPEESRPCDLDAQGKTVLWPRLDDLGEPLGTCQRGLQRCDDAGQWGACGGLIPPSVERCDGLDNDCDGLFDNDAVDAPLWQPDHDGDGFADASTAPVARCENPGKNLFFCRGSKEPCPGSWRLAPELPDGDCDDLDATIHPGAWDGPAIPRLLSGIVPPGLQAQFFAVEPDVPPDLSVLPLLPGKTRTDIALDFRIARGALAPDLPSDVAARWTGHLAIREAGVYLFHTVSDDGLRLWVNDQLLIDDWTTHAETENFAAIQLPEGDKIPILVEWFDSGSEGTLSLQWAPPGMDRRTLTILLDPPSERLASRCDAVDDDCDGTRDNGVFQDPSTGLELSCTNECDPLSLDPALFMTRPCNEPPSPAGVCHPGVQSCLPSGTWSACAGDVQAGVRDCTSPLDNNCDGAPDDQVEGGCSCDPVGAIEEFEPHPAQDGVGVCRAGVRECVQKGGAQVWEVLAEPVGPSAERCQVQQDYDCNGVIGDAACRKPLFATAFLWSEKDCSSPPWESFATFEATPESGAWAALSVWVNPEDTTGMAPVYRCYCPSSKNYTTTSIDVPCDSPQIGCTGLEDVSYLMGHVSRDDRGGYTPVTYAQLANTTTGYCSGESGCAFIQSCLEPLTSPFWTY